MKILFTAPPSFFDPEGRIIYRETPPLAVYSLSPLLEAAGHQVEILEPMDFLRLLRSEGSPASYLRNFDLVAISANTGTWPFARQLMERAGNDHDLPPFVLGGIHPTLFDRHILQTTPARFVVRGEGERALPALAGVLEKGGDLSSIPGLSFKTDGAIVRNEDARLLSEEEIAAFAPPDFARIRPGDYFGLAVETSRGCLFNCVFCSITNKRCWRGVAADAILRRVEHALAFADRVSENYLFFVDDCFTADARRVAAVCAALARQDHDIHYGLEARATDLIRRPVIEGIAGLRVKFIQIGVECGYQVGLNRVKKGVSLDQVRQCARLLAEHGLIEHAKFSYIVGFPWETREMMEETMRFAYGVAGEFGGKIQISWLNLFPGSELYEKRHQYGITVEEGDFDIPNWHLDKGFFLRSHPNLTGEDVEYLGLCLSLLRMSNTATELHTDFFRVDRSWFA